MARDRSHGSKCQHDDSSPISPDRKTDVYVPHCAATPSCLAPRDTCRLHVSLAIVITYVISSRLSSSADLLVAYAASWLPMVARLNWSFEKYITQSPETDPRTDLAALPDISGYSL